MRFLRVRVPDEEQSRMLEALRSASGPTRTYFVLTILSTIIATYGLISNSTATVIGAMLVAPLMGPILGFAMGTVREDHALTATALAAEVGGVVICVTTACLVGVLVSPSAIDFASHEIAARTHPTLYDMAVGVAAGLAGAYAAINRRVSASAAGVAVAVALVPPLAVCGLCLVGALMRNPLLWTSAVNAFLLFLANFLTIEVAAVGVFLLGGFSQLQRRVNFRFVVQHFGINAMLLLAVGAFLSQSLTELLRARTYETRAREVLSSDLTQIPGATIDSLAVRLDKDRLDVYLVTLSPQEVPATLVKKWQDDIVRALGCATRLTVRTVNSVYLTADGRLFEPGVNETPDPRQVLARQIQQALRSALRQFPEAELVDFRQSSDGRQQLFVTARAPYVFDPPRVALLEQGLNADLERVGIILSPFKLVVRSILSRDATTEGYLDPPVADDEADDRRRQLILTAQQVLHERVARLEGAVLIDVTLSPSGEAVVSPAQIDPPVSPAPSVSPYGRSGGCPPSPLASASAASSGVGSPSPAALPPAPVPVPAFAIVQSPHLLDAGVVAEWQDALQAALGVPIDLTVENRIGRRVSPRRPSMKTPSDERRRARPPSSPSHHPRGRVRDGARESGFRAPSPFWVEQVSCAWRQRATQPRLGDSVFTLLLPATRVPRSEHG